MTYKLEFLPTALKEWEKLGHTVREQIKKKLRGRLEAPRVQADALRACRDTSNQAAHFRVSPGLSGRAGTSGCNCSFRGQTRAWSSVPVGQEALATGRI